MSQITNTWKKSYIKKRQVRGRQEIIISCQNTQKKKKILQKGRWYLAFFQGRVSHPGPWTFHAGSPVAGGCPRHHWGAAPLLPQSRPPKTVCGYCWMSPGGQSATSGKGAAPKGQARHTWERGEGCLSSQLSLLALTQPFLEFLPLHILIKNSRRSPYKKEMQLFPIILPKRGRTATVINEATIGPRSVTDMSAMTFSLCK